jgi:hypothetical protein
MDCTTPHKYSQMLKPWIKYLKYNYLNLDTVVALGTFSKHSSISCSSCSIRDVAIWTCSSQHTQINKLQHDLYLFLQKLINQFCSSCAKKSNAGTEDFP